MKPKILKYQTGSQNTFGKTLKTIILSICLILGTNQAFSQRGHGHGNAGHGGGHPHGRNRVVVRGNGHQRSRVMARSVYRPANVIVFHPHWHPAYSYHRRWVYFPRYNFYWDNWRQGYYYMNGPVWVFNATPPPVIVNVNLEKEKKYELKEDEDDLDDVYRTNDQHKTEYKPE